MGGYIGEHGRQTLRKYKYSGIDRSIMSNYIFQPFWARFVKLFPIWMPPNLITLIGFFFVVGSTILSYVYAPRLDTPAPRYLYLVHGILLFLYQTFDAVDGKQARRTNSSSPLGELFDHGCDALTCAFEGLAFGATLLLGRNVLWILAIVAVPFFFATWETFYTDTLTLGEVNGPTEGLFLTYMAHIFTFFVGPNWWMLDFRDALGLPNHLWRAFIPEMRVNQLVLVLTMAAAVAPTVATNFANVENVMRSRKGGNMLEAVLLLMPFVSFCSMVCAWALLSPSDVLGNQPYLFLIGNGFAFGFLVGRVILAHLTDEKKGLKTSMSLSLVLLPIAVLNALSAKFLNEARQPFFDEFRMLLVFVLFTTVLYLHFAKSVISEITSALGIKCFSTAKDPAVAAHHRQE